MVRSTPEWIGKDDDQQIPPRVKLRVFEAAGGRCEECSRKIGASDKWVCDHTQAIINGGENRESNLRCICDWCDKKVKTPADVKVKAKSARIRAKQAGIKPVSKWNSRNTFRRMPSNVRDIND